jgi:hypothetical protein
MLRVATQISLDWKVDVLDAANLLAGGNFNTGGSARWGEGDFNYDGMVDILDVAGFITTGLYDQGTYNVLPGANGAAVAVPEPSGAATLTALFGLAGWLVVVPPTSRLTLLLRLPT